MANFNIYAIIDGKTAYNFGTISTRGTAENLCKKMARTYYDTLCAVHTFGRVAWGAIDPATGATVGGVAVSLNVCASSAIFKGFQGLELPPAIDIESLKAGAR